MFEPIERDDGSIDTDALLLTEQGSERRAGVWCVTTETMYTTLPLDKLGPRGGDDHGSRTRRTVRGQTRCASTASCATNGWVSGVGRRLANEVCRTARISPFANTAKLGSAGAGEVVEALRPGHRGGSRRRNGHAPTGARRRTDRARVHARTGEACPVCGDTIRAVSYSGYTVNYCPTCQTDGKMLADNTTSKFLK